MLPRSWIGARGIVGDGAGRSLAAEIVPVDRSSLRLLRKDGFECGWVGAPLVDEGEPDSV